MKTLRYFLPLSVVLCMAGCTTPFRPWNLSDVHEGMDRDQVVRLLGNPDSTEVEDGAENLHYIYREDYNPTMKVDPFSDTDPERAFRDLNSQRMFKKFEYVVILVDGKVSNYKEL